MDSLFKESAKDLVNRLFCECFTIKMPKKRMKRSCKKKVVRKLSAYDELILSDFETNINLKNLDAEELLKSKREKFVFKEIINIYNTFIQTMSN